MLPKIRAVLPSTETQESPSGPVQTLLVDGLRGAQLCKHRAHLLPGCLSPTHLSTHPLPPPAGLLHYTQTPSTPPPGKQRARTSGGPASLEVTGTLGLLVDLPLPLPPPRPSTHPPVGQIQCLAAFLLAGSQGPLSAAGTHHVLLAKCPSIFSPAGVQDSSPGILFWYTRPPATGTRAKPTASC